MASDLGLFRATFARVSDAYGIEKAFGPEAIRLPITDELLLAHLEGKKRVGAYAVDADGMADQIVIDHDIDKAKVDDPAEWERVRTEAKRVLAIFDKIGVEAFVTSSKSRGYHVRALFDVAPAGDLRRIGIYVTRRAGIDKIEIFPKQSQRKTDGLGSFTWLPLHGKSLEKGKTAFVDPENGMDALTDQWEALRGVRRNPMERLASVLAIVEEWEQETGMTNPATPAAAAPVEGTILSGERNNKLHSMAGSMRRRGFSVEAIETALQVENLSKCSPPLPLDEVKKIAASAGRYPPVIEAAPDAPVELEDAQTRPELFANVTIDKIIPPDGFLKDYLDAFSPQTDAPRVYHLLMAYYTIGAVVRNGVYFTLAGDKLYPNLWVVLIGKSSQSRKSTALNKSKSLVAYIDPEMILPSDFTSEALIDNLEGHPQGAFYHPEFRSLNGLLSKDYMSGVKALLTELYDSPPEYRRETKAKSVTIRQPIISMASATTTQWLTSRNSEEDFASGFLARWLFVPALTREGSMPIPPKPDTKRFKALLQHLEAIRVQYATPTEAQYTDAAEELYKDWYINFDSLDPFAHTPMGAFHARYQAVAHKFAMIYTLSIGGDITQMDVPAVVYATATIEWITRNLAQLYDKFLTFGRSDEQMRKIIDRLPANGKAVKRRDLLRFSRLNLKDFSGLISTLVEIGTVKESKARFGGNETVLYSRTR